jgi:hypothetical protein
MGRESNNRLNDDDRAEKKRKKKTIEGNTFERGQNTEQQYKMEIERREKGQQAGYK